MSGNDSPKTTFYTEATELHNVFREYHYQNRTHSRRSFRDVGKSYRMIGKNASSHLLTMGKPSEKYYWTLIGIIDSITPCYTTRNSVSLLWKLLVFRGPSW